MCTVLPYGETTTGMDHIHTGLNPNCKLVSPRVPSFRKHLLGVQGAVV